MNHYSFQVDQIHLNIIYHYHSFKFNIILSFKVRLLTIKGGTYFDTTIFVYDMKNYISKQSA